MSIGPVVPSVFTPAISRLYADVVEQFGCESVRFVPAGTQNRPASHLLRVAVYGGGDADPRAHLYIKIFKPKDIEGGNEAMRQRVARDFETTRQAYDALRGEAELSAVRPVACYPDLLTIVTQEASGVTLLEYLESHAAWFPTRRAIEDACATAHTVGRWIRRFQEHSPVGAPLVFGDIREYIDVRLRRLLDRSGGWFTATDRGRVLAHLDRLAASIDFGRTRSATAHSDLSLGNILVSESGVTVLDFAMTRLDTPLCDIAKVFFQIGLLATKPQFQRRGLREICASLLDGFDATLTADDPLFRIMMVVHRINHMTQVVVRQSGGLEGVYDAVLRRTHRRALANELAAPIAVNE